MATIKSIKTTDRDGTSRKYTLNSDINVIFGRNGSGKTSLLRLLHSALSLDKKPLQPSRYTDATITIHDPPDRPVRLKYNSPRARITQREFELLAGDFNEDHEPLLDDEHPLSAARRSWTPLEKLRPTQLRGWSHVYLPTTRLVFGRESYLLKRAIHDADMSEQWMDRMFEQALERTWVDLYSKLQTDIKQAQQQALDDIVNTILSPGTVGQEHRELDFDDAYRRVTSFAERQSRKNSHPVSKQQLKARFSKEPILKSTIARIDAVEKEIAKLSKPKTHLQEILSRLFYDKTISLKSDRIGIVTSSGRPLSTSRLSSGEKHLLRVLIEVFRAGDGPYIVDEPEMSLHVDWQRILINALRELNPSAQIIMATHSPEIMASLPDHTIFRI